MIGEAHEYHLLILEKHLDTFGHVNNASYLEILEEARWLESYSGRTGQFAQQILADDGELCCDAMFTIGLFDLTARRLIRPTPEWVRGLGLRPEDLRTDGGGGP